MSAAGKESESPTRIWLAFDEPSMQPFQLQARSDGGLEIMEVASIQTARIEMGEWGFDFTKSIGSMESLVGHPLSAVKLLAVPVDGVVGFYAEASECGALWVANLGDDLYVGIGDPLTAPPGAESAVSPVN